MASHDFNDGIARARLGFSWRYTVLAGLEQPLRKLAQPFGCLSSFINGIADRFAICPDCGRNRYTGAPCKNLSSTSS